MALDDVKISEIIIKSFSEKLLGVLSSDVAVVGGGPAGRCRLETECGGRGHCPHR